MMLTYRQSRDLLWAVELCVAYNRFLFLRNEHLSDNPETATFARSMWVRTCMRLGSSAAEKILRSTPGSGVLVVALDDVPNDHGEIR